MSNPTQQTVLTGRLIGAARLRSPAMQAGLAYSWSVEQFPSIEGKDRSLNCDHTRFEVM